MHTKTVDSSGKSHHHHTSFIPIPNGSAKIDGIDPKRTSQADRANIAPIANAGTHSTQLARCYLNYPSIPLIPGGGRIAACRHATSTRSSDIESFQVPVM
jgi:hypothetical protein